MEIIDKSEQQIKDEIREKKLLQFKKAMDSMPLDNIVLKQKVKQTKYNNDQVRRFINEPQKYQKELRAVVDNLSSTYPQFTVI